MRRGRIIVGVVLLFVAVLLVAGLVWVRSMLSPQRFTAMLRDQVNAAGLRMQLDGPAQPTIWPHLAVRLDGLSLRRAGNDERMLGARQVLLVVPWSSLLRGETRIENLKIDSPRIDLQQAQAWLGEYRQQNAESSQLEVPTIEAGVQLVDGTVLKGSSLLLKSLNVDTGALKSGQPFQLNIQAMDPDNRPLVMQVETTPQQHGASLQFNPLKIHVAAGAPPSLRLAGQLQWFGGLDFSGALGGTLSLEKGDYKAAIKFVPATDGSADPSGMSMRVIVDGDSTHMDLAMNPAQAWQWWQQISASDAGSIPLPPVRGTISAERLDVGSLHIEGLHVQAAQPGTSASVATAAHATSTVGKP